MGINVPITADNKSFIKAINEVKKGIEETAETAKDSGGEIEAIFDRMKKAAAGFFAGYGVKEFISNILEVRGEFQKLEVSFKTMLGSAEKSEELMSQLTKTAAITPFGLQDVANGAKQLLAFGIAAEDVNETLIRLGDISAGLSIPLNDLVYLYGTTMTQGQLFTQDLRQFMSRGIPIADELAEMFGVAKEEVGDLVTEGKVGFEEVKIAIENMTNEGGKFGGLMEAQSKTIAGQISNIEDSIDTMFNEIGKSSEGIINDALSAVAFLIEHYKTLGNILKYTVSVYGAYKAAVMTIIALQKLQALGLANQTVAEAIHTIAIKAKDKAMKVLNKTMMSNPFVLAAMAVTAYAVALMSAKSAAERLAEAQSNYKDALDEVIKKEEEYNQKINDYLSVAENERLSIDERLDAMHNLEREYPDIFEKYETEIELLENISEIHKEIAERQKETSLKKTENELRYVEDEIKILNKSRKKWDKYANDKTLDRVTMLSPALYFVHSKTSKKGRDRKAALDAAHERRTVLLRELGREKFFAPLDDLSQYSDKQLSEMLGDIISKNYQPFLNNEEVKKILTHLGVDSNEDISTILEALEIEDSDFSSYRNQIERELNQRNAEQRTVAEFLKIYETNYQEALEDYNNFLNNEQDKYNEREAHRIAEEKKAAVEQAKKILKKFKEESTKEDDEAKKEEEKKVKKREAEKKERLEAEKKSGEKLADLIIENNEAIIDAQKDGVEKEIARLELNHEKRKRAIKKKEDEFREENKKSKANVLEDGLTAEQRSAIDNAYLLAEQQKNSDIQNIRERERKKERADWQNYLIEFGNYQERRLAITQKYEDLIAKAETQGQKASLAEQRDNELEDLDIKFGKSASSMADLFEDASEKSINAIQALIDKYETLVNFMSTPGSVSREDLFALGFTERDLEKIEKGEISIKDITDAIKNLKREVGEKSPFKKFANDINKAFDKIGTKGNTGQGFIEIGDAVNSILPEIEKFATDIETIFGVEDSSISEIVGVVGGIGDAALGFGRIMSGDVLGGITSAAGGVASMIQNIQAINEKAYQQEKERLTDLANIYKELADKRKEEIDINNPNAVEDAKTAIDYYNKEREKYEDAYNKYLDRGKSSGWRASKSEKLWAHMSSEAIAQLEELTRKKGSLGIYELVNVDLDVLKENTELWNALDDETREYLENIHASNESIEETGEKLKQAYTGITLDDFYSSFVSTLSDMDASAEDFTNNFEEYLYNAIISSMVAKEFQDRINKLYENWTTASEDGLTDKEVEALRKEKENLTNDIIARRDAIKETYQFGQGEYSQQDASSKGFQSMSQETGEELNGRFTALQMAGEDIRTSMQTAVANMGQLITLSTDNNNTLLSIRESLVLSNSYLDSIDTTSKSILKTFGEKLNSLITNTDNLK